MKVLVVGSLNPPKEGDGKPDADFVANNKLRFGAACKALGGAFVRGDHTIMVGVPWWSMLQTLESVATFIIEGASEAASEEQKAKIIFYGPQEPEPSATTPEIDSLQELKGLPNIKWGERFVGRGKSKYRTIPNVAEVDAVLLVSGREGTESIGYAAYSMGKPVIAVTSLSGGAESMADEVLLDDYNRFVKQGVVTPEELRALDVAWAVPEKNEAGGDTVSKAEAAAKNNARANAVVTTSEKLVKAYGQSNRRTLRNLSRTVGVIVVLLLAWLFVYLRGARCMTATACGDWVTIAFFLLLYISALLGAGLRTLVTYQVNKIAQLTGLGLGMDAAISLLVAFGLALVYLIGGISFTGSVVALTGGAQGQANESSFATIAVSMSLLGLAAGYLVPLNQLSERLGKIVSQKEK